MELNGILTGFILPTLYIPDATVAPKIAPVYIQWLPKSSLGWKLHPPHVGAYRKEGGLGTTATGVS